MIFRRVYMPIVALAVPCVQSVARKPAVWLVDEQVLYS